MPGLTCVGELQLHDGTVNGKSVKVLRDSGCTMVGIKSSFIDKKDYLRELSNAKP